jgi:cysteine/glycine-rich protein
MNGVGMSGGSGKCPGCGKIVYDAESLKVDGRSWHNSCFKCKLCNKKLEFITYVSEKSIGEVYCKLCYSSLFGPKGFRGSTVGIASGASPSGNSTCPAGAKFDPETGEKC